MRTKNTKIKELFVQRGGEMKTWVTLVVYAWLVILSVFITLELVR